MIAQLNFIYKEGKVKEKDREIKRERNFLSAGLLPQIAKRIVVGLG